jgi:hypothetical protein
VLLLPHPRRPPGRVVPADPAWGGRPLPRPPRLLSPPLGERTHASAQSGRQAALGPRAPQPRAGPVRAGGGIVLGGWFATAGLTTGSKAIQADDGRACWPARLPHGGRATRAVDPRDQPGSRSLDDGDLRRKGMECPGQDLGLGMLKVEPQQGQPSTATGRAPACGSSSITCCWTSWAGAVQTPGALFGSDLLPAPDTGGGPCCSP